MNEYDCFQNSLTYRQNNFDDESIILKVDSREEFSERSKDIFKVF
jgi:hypothetical protein